MTILIGSIKASFGPSRFTLLCGTFPPSQPQHVHPWRMNHLLSAQGPPFVDPPGHLVYEMSSVSVGTEQVLPVMVALLSSLLDPLRWPFGEPAPGTQLNVSNLTYYSINTTRRHWLEVWTRRNLGQFPTSLRRTCRPSCQQTLASWYIGPPLAYVS